MGRRGSRRTTEYHAKAVKNFTVFYCFVSSISGIKTRKDREISIKGVKKGKKKRKGDKK